MEGDVSGSYKIMAGVGSSYDVQHIPKHREREARHEAISLL